MGEWRKVIADRLRERNKLEVSTFSEIIVYNNRLYDQNTQLRTQNLKLNIDYERVQFGGTGDTTSTKIQAFEKKLMLQQEELTELHRRKGENAQRIVEMNVKLSEQSDVLAEREKALAEQITVNSSLRAEVQMLTTSIEELKGINTILRDEYTALQLVFNALEERFRKSQDENGQLLNQVIKFKERDADKMNEQNENFFKKCSDKMKEDLLEAQTDNTRRSSSPVVVNPDKPNLNDFCGTSAMAGGFFSDELPTKVQKKFDAHDGEVNAVRWSPIDRLVATGGADRKVKLWDVGKGIMEPRGTLVGSNAGINSVDFDSAGSMIMGTSNDFATRVWTVADQRIRFWFCRKEDESPSKVALYTLTGHSGKVMAAKFLGDPSRVVTGSHDATLKIWDLKSKACVETKFAGSRCNDLVTTDGSGSTIISGHFDKKIRFWDTHTHSSVNDIELQGKITSLDLSRDCKYLLCCVRDNTIKLIDLRQNQIISSFSNDNFKVSCDSARVAFSADGYRLAAGSADGSIYIWNVSGKLESILKDHANIGGYFNRSAAVTAVSWHPFSSVLASVDRAKKCTIWADA